MPVVSEVVHPSGLNFQQQRRVVLFRDVQGMSFSRIAEKVKNLKNKRPTKQTVATTYHEFDLRKGRKVSNYSKCGRKPYKVTAEVEAFLIKRLLALRGKCVCTSSVLQREVAKEMDIKITRRTVQRVLAKRGYKWLPRSGKRVYSRPDKLKRLAFAREVVGKTPQQLKTYVAMCIDGVVLTVPPGDAVDRENYCRHGDSHMYRKRDEMGKQVADGAAGRYPAQAGPGRVVPLWGGLGEKGFAVITYHDKRKTTAEEWKKVAIDSGKLVQACMAVSGRQRGPYRVICDNESFLKSNKAGHGTVNVEMWHIPPRSPDLNPIEMFWGWLRKELLRMDLADLCAKKAPVGKSALKQRVRILCSGARAKRVARNCHRHLRTACKKVIQKKGAAAGN
jgi:transposase